MRSNDEAREAISKEIKQLAGRISRDCGRLARCAAATAEDVDSGRRYPPRINVDHIERDLAAYEALHLAIEFLDA
jgi:hypothetical protein